MIRSEILLKIQDIFREVLEIEDLIISEETKASDISEWDSINHIYLIVEIENNFKVKFTTHEIQLWKNVGEMIDSIENRMSN